MPDRPTDVVKVEEDSPRETSAEALIEQSDLTSADVERAEEVAGEQQKGRPHVTLGQYQKLIVTVTRRFVAMMICRQGGKTFASCLRVARKVLERPLPYYILSRSERQSGNAIAQTAVHLRAIEKALRARSKSLAGAPAKYATQRLRYHRADGTAVEYNRLTIALPNGSRVVGLPASPDTVVGISGCVYGD